MEGSSSSPHWAPDPFGRHVQRYWNGNAWTEHVADGHGGQSTDPPVPSPPSTSGPQPAGTIAQSQSRKKGSRRRTITETQVTCSSCGNVWHFGKREATDNAANAMSNAGKSMMCCSGCAPAALIGDKKVVDLKQCPKCGSRATTARTVTHEV